MPTPSYTVVCKRKRLIAPGVYELAFAKPGGFRFKAGQFVLFDVPLLSNPSDIQPRALSIASTNDEEELLFVVKMKPGGRASEWVEKMLQEESIVRMQGPFGFFTITPDPTMHYVFVATGAGIAPFRSQVRWLLTEMQWKGKLDIVFGVRSEHDLFWSDAFEPLEKAHVNFQFHRTFSAPHPEWKGKVGRVQTHLPALITDATKSHVYICGAPEMVQDVKKFCLETLKFDKKHVHAEGYI